MPKGEKQPQEKSLEGIISITGRGTGFLMHPSLHEDVLIEREHLSTALHGDTVVVEFFPQKKKERKKGKVIRVVKRAKTKFVGNLIQENGNWELKPDSRKMHTSIRIKDTKEHSLSVNHKALVKLEKWNDATQKPSGTILKILGPQGDHEVEMQSIVLEKGFEPGFPNEVEQQAQAIPKTISKEEVGKRRDVRNITTFTIDPFDAKDFDDALSVQTLPSGDIEVGVHIADVSHYVQPGSAIDDEARERGTSIYLVDRTIPMLPEVLSNDVCSLNPNEDKLTYSAIFTLDKEGTVKNQWFGETVIHSDKRFMYEEAQNILDAQKGLYYDELSLLNNLAHKLRQKRFKNGSITFSQDEIKFTLDENGKPLSVTKKQLLDTNLLVEDFMLLANKCVATYMHKLCEKSNLREALFVYRIHDVPNPEKIEELGIFLRAIGYDFETSKGEVTAKEINNLFKQIEGKPEENLIKTATIRSMAKAVYSTKNMGHFGLSFQYYTHFTSPIRRYPDLMVHRILKSHLDGKKLSKQELMSYEKLAIQSSEREIAAIEAERDSVKYKQVEYMKEHVGETFSGIISGITDWGIFVEEKETKAEGMIRLANMKDDYYTFDSKHYRLVGEKKKKKYTLGDEVTIKLINADLEERTLEWKLV